MTGQEYKEATLKGVNLCGEARRSGLTEIIKTGDETDHHPQAVELMKFLETLDILDYDSHFSWIWSRSGGNGEVLMAQLDTYFKQKEKEENEAGTTTKAV